jgi:hypothetical protein
LTLLVGWFRERLGEISVLMFGESPSKRMGERLDECLGERLGDSFLGALVRCRVRGQV